MATHARQTSIPGTERSPEDPVFEEKLEELRLLRQERIATQQKEKSALDAVLAYHRTKPNPPDVHRYFDQDNILRIARFKTVTKVSVRSEKSDDDDDQSSDDDDGGVGVQ